MGKYCHPHLDKGYEGIDEWNELHKDQWQEQNPQSSDVLFYILAKAVSCRMLQVSYSCMGERVSLLNYWAHLVVGVFWWFVFLVYFTLWSHLWIQFVLQLDPGKRAGKSVQKNPSSYISVFSSCEDRRGCHYCYCYWQSALTGKLERTVALFSLKVDGRWWIEFFQ